MQHCDLTPLNWCAYFCANYVRQTSELYFSEIKRTLLRQLKDNSVVKYLTVTVTDFNNTRRLKYTNRKKVGKCLFDCEGCFTKKMNYSFSVEFKKQITKIVIFVGKQQLRNLILGKFLYPISICVKYKTFFIFFYV